MIKIKFFEKQTDNGKMADADLHFTEGPLEGLKLTGFTIWRSKVNDGYNVTYPSRQYVNRDGEKQNFYFLRPGGDENPQKALDGIRSFILDEFEQHLARKNDL